MSGELHLRSWLEKLLAAYKRGMLEALDAHSEDRNEDSQGDVLLNV